MKNSLTNGQQAVLRAFHELGPMTDMALTVYVHHVADEDMSSSGIRTRRAELSRLDKPLVTVVGTKKAKSGRKSAVHDLTPTGKKLAKRLFADRTAVTA